MKKILFAAQVGTCVIPLLFVWVAVMAADECMVSNLESITREKTSLLAVIAFAFSVCGLAWLFGSLIERMFEDMRSRNPDVGTDEDGRFVFDPEGPVVCTRKPR